MPANIGCETNGVNPQNKFEENGPRSRIRFRGGASMLDLVADLSRAARRLIKWPWFDRVVLLLICLNCAFLAGQGPPGSAHATFEDAEGVELVFTLLFTFEMLAKWIALGVVCSETAYVRDPWNLLDMTVVFAGWAPLFFPQLDNLSALRSIRALRPLRSVQRLPGLRRQVATMLNSIPKLADVALLGGFILLG